MPAMLLGLLTPRNLIYLAIGLALAFFAWKAWGFVEDKYAAEKEVARLESVVEDMTAAMEVLNFQADQNAIALEAANAARQRSDKKATQYRTIRDRAVGAIGDDDAEVAPALRGVLDDLKRLQPE